MSSPIRAEVFPPGAFIQEEMEARGWSVTALAEEIGLTSAVPSELIAGESAVTPEIAQGLASAFGTSAEYWINLESAWASARRART